MAKMTKRAWATFVFAIGKGVFQKIRIDHLISK